MFNLSSLPDLHYNMVYLQPVDDFLPKLGSGARGEDIHYPTERGSEKAVNECLEGKQYLHIGHLGLKS